MKHREIFLDVLAKTLKELTGIDFKLEYKGKEEKFVAKKEITSQISLFGPEHEGIIIINIDKSDINFLYTKIENDSLLEEDEFLIEDFLGELTNIITGKFIEFLEIEINPSVPFIHFGKTEYSTLRKNKFDVISLSEKNDINFLIYIYLGKLEKGF